VGGVGYWHWYGDHDCDAGEYLADAQATAVMVDGIDAQLWVVREELREYSFYVINRHEGTAWLYGPNKGY
jgi:thiamine biosynthesis lipoprotein